MPERDDSIVLSGLDPVQLAQLRLIARLHGRTVEEEVEAIVLEKIRQAEDVITGDRPSRVPEKDC